MNRYSDASSRTGEQIPAGYDEDPNEITINLKNVWRILRQKFWVMLLAAVIGGLAVFGIGRMVIPPEYTVKSIIYLQPKEILVDDNGKIGTFDRKIINNAMYIVENEDLMNKLADMSHYETPDDVRDSLDLLAYGEADMLEVNIIGSTAQEAYDLSVTFCDEAMKLLEKDIPYANISLIQEPVMPRQASNEITLVHVILGAAAGFIISFLILLFRGLKDTRMQTREEGESFFGKTVFAVLPEIKDKGTGDKQ